jgi:hypothetical protein
MRDCLRLVRQRRRVSAEIVRSMFVKVLEALSERDVCGYRTAISRSPNGIKFPANPQAGPVDKVSLTTAFVDSTVYLGNYHLHKQPNYTKRHRGQGPEAKYRAHLTRKGNMSPVSITHRPQTFYPTWFRRYWLVPTWLQHNYLNGDSAAVYVQFRDLSPTSEDYTTGHEFSLIIYKYSF